MRNAYSFSLWALSYIMADGDNEWLAIRGICLEVYTWKILDITLTYAEDPHRHIRNSFCGWLS